MRFVFFLTKNPLDAICGIAVLLHFYATFFLPLRAQIFLIFKFFSRKPSKHFFKNSCGKMQILNPMRAGSRDKLFFGLIPFLFMKFCIGHSSTHYCLLYQTSTKLHRLKAAAFKYCTLKWA